jgi:hypothetical protein
MQNNGAGFDLHKLIGREKLENFVPGNDETRRAYLKEEWLKLCKLPWDVPLDAIQNYYGSRIAMVWMNPSATLFLCNYKLFFILFFLFFLFFFIFYFFFFFFGISSAYCSILHSFNRIPFGCYSRESLV